MLTTTAPTAWLTVPEAAARARWNIRTIERYIDAGRLTAYVCGRSVRVKAADLDALFIPVGGGARV